MRLHIPLIAMLLVALLAPHAAAAKCPELVVWASDDAKDVYELPENLNGGMDILELRVGQGGDACDRVLLGVTVNDPLAVDPAAGSGAQDPEQPFNAGSQRVIVSPTAVEGQPVVEVHFIWALRTHTDETAHEGWAVELYLDGERVSDTFAGDNAKLSDEDDELTPTMKVRRSFMYEQYGELIEEMYQR